MVESRKVSARKRSPKSRAAQVAVNTLERLCGRAFVIQCCRALARLQANTLQRAAPTQASAASVTPPRQASFLAMASHCPATRGSRQLQTRPHTPTREPPPPTSPLQPDLPTSSHPPPLPADSGLLEMRETTVPPSNEGPSAGTRPELTSKLGALPWHLALKRTSARAFQDLCTFSITRPPSKASCP